MMIGVNIVMYNDGRMEKKLIKREVEGLVRMERSKR